MFTAKTNLHHLKSKFSNEFLGAKVEQIDEMISKKSAERNVKIIHEQLGNLMDTEGKFSNVGMWKIRSKLFPQVSEPPIAKKRQRG